MKFSINRLELLEALTVTGKAISPIGILPILSSYLFDISDDKIRITGGSNDLTINYNLEIVPCGINKSIAIPKTKLFDLISDSPNQPIEFEIRETQVKGQLVPSSVKIKTSIGKYVIPVVSGEDYPFLSIENPTSFSIPKDTLIKGIETTLFACSNNESMPAITGVYVYLEGDKVEFASTNRFVVAAKSLALTEALMSRRSMILPKKILNALLSLPSEETIGVMVTDKNIRFSLSPNISVESVLIDATFVDYRNVIPTNQQNHLVIRKSQLYSSLKRVNRFSDLGTSQLIVEFAENSCNISTNNDLGDQADETLEINYTGGSIRIGMSGKLLMESLNRIRTDNVSISFSNPSEPFILRDSDNNTAVNTKQNMILVMPMDLLN